MVQYDPKTWFALIFHSYSRQVVRTLFPGLVMIGIYTTAICYMILDVLELDFISTTSVHSLLGIVLGLFLVFRVNSAYDRWWEGRKLWGLLLNNTRNFASKLSAFLDDGAGGERGFFVQVIGNYVTAMRNHLRKGVQLEELDLIEGEGMSMADLKNKEHVPNFLSLLMMKRINKLYKKKVLTGDQFFVLDKEIKEFSDILGGCERIKYTPIPYSYSMYIKKFIFTFTVTLPFAFMTEFHYWTVPIVLLIFFILVSVELISEEIEDPFGKDSNDLPTDELCDKIKRNTREILLTS